MPQEQSARNTLMQMNEVYFWSDTVKEWKHLLKQDRYKQISVDSWCGLIVSGLTEERERK
jgi:putative transposase